MATNERWTQLALAPTESLETELKGWLDLNSNEDKANLAHAILALANHGGGTILIGYEGVGSTWSEVAADPLSLDSFTTDAINGIVEKFADPPFHCELHMVEHELLQHPHPVVVVPGGHRVPVRAKRDGPERKHVLKDTYYIRRPGPQSAPPQSASEWQQFIHRCVMADRDSLLDNLRAALSGEISRTAAPSLDETAAKWEGECIKRFKALVDQKQAQVTYERGYYSCSYVFGDRPHVDVAALLDALRAAERQTGWPVWIVFDRTPIAPYPMDGQIECHVYEREQAREPARSDFWRAAPDGKFFLLRGFREDHTDQKEKIAPGTALDRALSIRIIGECLMHAARMAQTLGVPTTAVNIRLTWVGLSGRRLSNLYDDWFDGLGQSVSRQEVVSSQLTVDADRVRLQLADLVIELTKPLFQVFNFENPQRPRVEEVLAKLLQRTGGA